MTNKTSGEIIPLCTPLKGIQQNSLDIWIAMGKEKERERMSEWDGEKNVKADAVDTVN